MAQLVSRPEEVRRIMRRRKTITSREVADRLGIGIKPASVITHRLAIEDGLLYKRTKVRKPGIRWFWLYTKAGVA